MLWVPAGAGGAERAACAGSVSPGGGSRALRWGCCCSAIGCCGCSRSEGAARGWSSGSMGKGRAVPVQDPALPAPCPVPAGLCWAKRSLPWVAVDRLG